MAMPYTEFVLDEPRRLRFTVNACVKLEEMFEQPISRFVREFTGIDHRKLRAVLWAGLLHDKQPPTLEQVGDLIDTFLANGGDLVELFNAYDAAIAASGLLGRLKPDVAKPEGGAEGNVVAAAPASSG